MRWKIILVNGGIVLLVGVIIYVLVSSSMEQAVSNQTQRKQDVAQAARTANTQLALDALRLERWLDQQAEATDVRGVFSAGTMEARRKSATATANRVLSAALSEPDFEKTAPSLVLFVDNQGMALGRSGSSNSALMRGDNLLQVYPSLAEPMTKGGPSSHVWLNRARQDQMLVSYAPIRSDDKKTVGVMVIGAPLNDERLARINELAQENSLMVGLLSSNRTLELIANSSTAPAEVLDAVRQPSVEGAIRTAVETNALTVAEEPSSGYLFAVAPLQGYGKTQALLIATVPASLVLGLPRQLATTIFGVTALGLLLVAFGGYLLGNYLSRPIGELEDGLLAIINGDSELRFQIEHSELGGLVFRINSLLNAMMGVAEESTDDQGGSAATPSAHTFQDPLGVDESLLVSDQADPGASATLAREPADQYYRRVFEEFIAAKRQLGDPVDHIGFESFRERIEQSERDLLQSHSRPVRFRVAVRDGAVVLTAVPIG